MKLPWVHKLVAAWMRILLTLSISYVSLECSHHDLSLPAASRNATETQDADHFAENTFVHPPLGSDEVQWVILTACHCYLWWRWWSDTLWATLSMSWPHALSCYFRTVLVEISLQSHRPALCMGWVRILLSHLSFPVNGLVWNSLLHVICLMYSLVPELPIGHSFSLFHKCVLSTGHLWHCCRQQFRLCPNLRSMQKQ